MFKGIVWVLLQKSSFLQSILLSANRSNLVYYFRYEFSILLETIITY